MPTLDWIGKKNVITHHTKVPYRVLKRIYSFDEKGSHRKDNGSENMIIHGDNLEALKALMPIYERRVKCIYIDPPYNTGNEGWVYNDNVNDPRIKRWLNEVVGKEGEDFTRHDKWLCMMYPRLALLRKLLRDDGVIFISIDDNEQGNLKMLCDEIFGATCFVGLIPWRKRTAKSDVPFGISQDYEEILCYAKSDAFRAGIQGKERDYYETDDFPGKPWRKHDLTKQCTAKERPNSFFTMVNPKTGAKYPANPLRTWAITKETFETYYRENRIIFPGDYPFLKISSPQLRYWKEDDEKKAGSNFGIVAASSNLPVDVGMTQDGTQEITAIFGEKVFNFPKPSSLIRHLIDIATCFDKDAIVLDSFAGSGTTAHAVLALNQKDGGERKFISVELCDYAENITAERVKRVIQGYGNKKNFVEGTGGDFSFYELGDRVILDDGTFNESLALEEMAAYVWETETHTPFKAPSNCEPSFLGIHKETAFYFFYDKKKLNTLNRKLLSKVKHRAHRYVIFADATTLSDYELDRYSIVFKKITRDVIKN